MERSVRDNLSQQKTKSMNFAELWLIMCSIDIFPMMDCVCVCVCVCVCLHGASKGTFAKLKTIQTFACTRKTQEAHKKLFACSQETIAHG